MHPKEKRSNANKKGAAKERSAATTWRELGVERYC